MQHMKKLRNKIKKRQRTKFTGTAGSGRVLLQILELLQYPFGCHNLNLNNLQLQIRTRKLADHTAENNPSPLQKNKNPTNILQKKNNSKIRGHSETKTEQQEKKKKEQVNADDPANPSSKSQNKPQDLSKHNKYLRKEGDA